MIRTSDLTLAFYGLDFVAQPSPGLQRRRARSAGIENHGFNNVLNIERSSVPSTLDAWVEGYRLAWENRDTTAVAALFTPDATYRSNIFEEAHEGRAGVKAYWESVTSSQSDVRVQMGRPFVDGSRVSVEFWTNMKVDHEEVTLPGCLLMDFDDNWLCRGLREYWHYAPGLMEPPVGWGE